MVLCIPMGQWSCAPFPAWSCALFPAFANPTNAIVLPAMNLPHRHHRAPFPAIGNAATAMNATADAATMNQPHRGPFPAIANSTMVLAAMNQPHRAPFPLGGFCRAGTDSLLVAAAVAPAAAMAPAAMAAAMAPATMDSPAIADSNICS